VELEQKPRRDVERNKWLRAVPMECDTSSLCVSTEKVPMSYWLVIMTCLGASGAGAAEAQCLSYELMHRSHEPQSSIPLPNFNQKHITNVKCLRDEEQNMR
jgi:hypothetical protein